MKFLSSLIASIISLTALADTVKNPDYEWCGHRCMTVTSVEMTPDSTVFNLRARWRPHYQIKVDKNTVIVDRATGTRYQPTGSWGITLGKLMRMPDSGEAEISLVYPGLPSGTTVVDFDPGFVNIKGLRLDGTEAVKPPKTDAGAWQTANTRPYPGKPSKFYSKGTVKLTGVISGYTPEMGFDNMVVYANDAITGKDTPVAVPVNKDGTFIALIPVSRPGFCKLSGPCHTYADLYVEPGRNLSLYIDWDSVTEREMNEVLDRPLNPFILHYGGSLGEINGRLAAAPRKEGMARSLSRDHTPTKAAAKLDSVNKAYSRAVEEYITENGVDSHSADLLRKKVKAGHLNDVLDYALFRDDLIYSNDTLAPSLQEPVTADFYTPMKEVMADKDEWMLTAMPPVLFNRINYCGLFDLTGNANNSGSDDEADVLKRKTDALKAFVGIDFSPLAWQEALSSQDICHTRGMDKDSLTRASQFEKVKRLEQSGVIDNPFILSSIDSFLNDFFNKESYTLPDTEAGRLMKSILAPHAGKYVLVDFWGTTCGPCRSNIEAQAEIRRRNHDNPDVKFVFITGENESPRDDYDSYVARNLAGEECHYLSEQDYRRMRELFGFNGIPRYVLISPDGMVADDNFISFNLKETLERNGKKLR